MPSPLILIPGTWAYQGSAWNLRGAPLVEHLLEQGLEPLSPDGEPFDWTENAGGLWAQAVFTGSAFRDWEAAGESLRWYAHAKYPPARDGRLIPVSLLTHSHGLQVAAFAATQGLVLDTVMSLAGPVRRDLMSQYRALRNQTLHRWIDVWAHEPLWAGGLPWQKLGSRFNRRDNPAAFPFHVDVGDLSHRGVLEVENPWKKFGLARAFLDPHWVPPTGWSL